MIERNVNCTMKSYTNVKFTGKFCRVAINNFICILYYFFLYLLLSMYLCVCVRARVYLFFKLDITLIANFVDISELQFTLFRVRFARYVGF